jgi:hypothetical protein
MIALAVPTLDGNAVAGAGITTSAVTHVLVQRRDGSPVASLPVVRGAFVLDERHGVTTRELLHGLRFIAG